MSQPDKILELLLHIASKAIVRNILTGSAVLVPDSAWESSTTLPYICNILPSKDAMLGSKLLSRDSNTNPTLSSMSTGLVWVSKTILFEQKSRLPSQHMEQ